jgi:hypothetical protein
MSNNVEWVMATKKGENRMLKSVSEYGKLKLPLEFTEFIEKLANETNSSESEVVKMGLTLLKLARKIKGQGFNLAVVDDDGTLISKIEY